MAAAAMRASCSLEAIWLSSSFPRTFLTEFECHLMALLLYVQYVCVISICQRSYLQEICHYMSIPGATPKRFIPHRWLSTYDVGLSTQTMLPAYKFMFFGFMTAEDKALYKEPLEKLYEAHHVNEKAQTRIQAFHKDLSGKGKSTHCSCRLFG